MDSYEYTFPIEHWWQILTNVSPGELCNVVLTSRHMNCVASLPELWAGIKVNTRKVRQNGLKEFYNINRFKKVKQINIEKSKWECGEFERLLKDIPGSPLENANLSRNDLRGESSELLASAVSHLHIVNLEYTRLKTDQCVALLKASLSSTTLKNINLRAVNLSQVPAELLANSISRLQKVNLHRTRLTTDQCVALLEASLSSTTLKNLNLEDVNLSQIPSELLANSISRLQEVNLRRTRFTTNQSVALLEASLSSKTLKNLNLEDVNLSQVPSELLANSISRLQEVNLSQTGLTTDQYVPLLMASLSSTTMRNLNLMSGNLREVPAELLASSITRLQDVNLYETYLSIDQCVALLKASLSSTTLRTVDLQGVYLDEVPADLLARSISRLQDVNLRRTGLTTHQCVALLEASLSSTTLRNVDLMHVDLSQVPSDLLANSISRLQDVNMYETDLTTDQCVALLKASLSSTTLRNVNLEDVNLSQVPAELLANSISRLQDVNLYGIDQLYLLTSLL